MSMKEFVDYYETHHRVIGEKILKPHASHYARRYLEPFANRLSGAAEEPEYDVIMEIWFPDQAALEAAMASISHPDNLAMIEEDENKLFDRPKMRSFLVRECESDMSC